MKSFKEHLKESRDSNQKFRDIVDPVNEMFDHVSQISSIGVVSKSAIDAAKKAFSKDAIRYISLVVGNETDPEVKQEIKEYLGGYLNSSSTFGLSRSEISKLLDSL